MQCGAGVREAAEDDALKRRRRLQCLDRGRDRDAGRAIAGKMIDAVGDGGEGDRRKAVLRTEPDRAGIARGEQLILAVAAAMPHRSHRMNHMLCPQTTSACDLGIAGGAAIQRTASFF